MQELKFFKNTQIKIKTIRSFSRFASIAILQNSRLNRFYLDKKGGGSKSKNLHGKSMYEAPFLSPNSISSFTCLIQVEGPSHRGARPTRGGRGMQRHLVPDTLMQYLQTIGVKINNSRVGGCCAGKSSEKELPTSVLATADVCCSSEHDRVTRFFFLGEGGKGLFFWYYVDPYALKKS